MIITITLFRERGVTVDCMADLERINYKEIGSDEIMRYHFPDRLVAYKFYNLYGCVRGLAGRRSRVVKNKDGDAC